MHSWRSGLKQSCSSILRHGNCCCGRVCIYSCRNSGHGLTVVSQFAHPTTPVVRLERGDAQLRVVFRDSLLLVGFIFLDRAPKRSRRSTCFLEVYRAPEFGPDQEARSSLRSCARLSSGIQTDKKAPVRLISSTQSPPFSCFPDKQFFSARGRVSKTRAVCSTLWQRHLGFPPLVYRKVLTERQSVVLRSPRDRFSYPFRSPNKDI